MNYWLVVLPVLATVFTGAGATFLNNWSGRRTKEAEATSLLTAAATSIVKSIQDQNSRLELNNERLEQSNNRLETEIVGLRQEVAHMSQELRTQSATMNDQVEQIRKLRAEVKVLREGLKRLGEDPDVILAEGPT